MTKRCHSVSSERTKLNSALITGTVKPYRPLQHLSDYSQHLWQTQLWMWCNTDGIGQLMSTNRAQHTQWTPALSKYNHAPRLANHNRRAWLSSHDTPATSAPSGGGSNPFRKNKICIIGTFTRGFRVPFRCRYVYYIKSHGDIPRNDV